MNVDGLIGNGALIGKEFENSSIIAHVGILT